ncbi:MAG: hypothetical protein IPM48_02785 [Saprospiraceae bacterium]|nr:hypothetical protein [Saprospiraceae bacterium]
MHYFKLSFLYTFLLLGFLLACGEDDGSTNDCSGIVATYDTTVKSHLDQNCALSGCHAGTVPANGIDLSNYASAKATATAVGNKMICAIEHGAGCFPMPPTGVKLDASVINVIKCWVQNGAPQ